MSLNHVQHSWVCSLNGVIFVLRWFLFKRCSPGQTLQRYKAVKSVFWTFSRWPKMTLSITLPNVQQRVKHTGGTMMKTCMCSIPSRNDDTETDHFSVIVFYSKKFVVRTKFLLNCPRFCMWTNGELAMKNVPSISSCSLMDIWSWRAWTGPSQSREQLPQAGFKKITG